MAGTSSVNRMHRVYGTVKYYVKGIRTYMQAHPIYLLAGGLAFNALLCVIPVLLFLFYGLGVWLEKRSILDVVGTQLQTFIPQQTYRTEILDVLRDQIDTIVRNGRIAGIIGILGSLWTGSALFASARTALNGIYGFRAERSLVLYKLRDIGMIFVSGLLVIVAVAVSPVATLAKHYGHSILAPELFHWLSGAVPFIVSVVFSLALFFLLYRSLAHHPVDTHSAFAGAVTATVLWECAKAGFTFYLTRFTTLGILYGAYTFLVVAALWVYYSAVVFIIGGIITRLYWEKKGSGV
ncbi:MAG TPA: YihY/virulence factor BrkB family protein [Candidatus Kapabacteria bacterium]|nr:YihY/virulence factor BrkB family protein [Candidatus Kapabacteria bacterium]